MFRPPLNVFGPEGLPVGCKYPVMHYWQSAKTEPVTLHFLDHGLAPDESVRRWQHRLDPLQQKLFGGCHLTRPIADLVTEAGFTITELDVLYEQGAPKPWAAASLGVAVAP